MSNEASQPRRDERVGPVARPLARNPYHRPAKLGDTVVAGDRDNTPFVGDGRWPGQQSVYQHTARAINIPNDDDKATETITAPA